MFYTDFQSYTVGSDSSCPWCLKFSLTHILYCLPSHRSFPGWSCKETACTHNLVIEPFSEEPELRGWTPASSLPSEMQVNEEDEIFYFKKKLYWICTAEAIRVNIRTIIIITTLNTIFWKLEASFTWATSIYPLKIMHKVWFIGQREMCFGNMGLKSTNNLRATFKQQLPLSSPSILFWTNQFGSSPLGFPVNFWQRHQVVQS